MGPSPSSERCGLSSAWRPPPPGSLPTGLSLPDSPQPVPQTLAPVLRPDETLQYPTLCTHLLGASLFSQGTRALSCLWGGPKAPIQISGRESISEVGLAYLASKEAPEPVSRAILS